MSTFRVSRGLGFQVPANNSTLRIMTHAHLPKPRYDLDAVAVSVGEDLHPLIPKPHKEQGLMKPWHPAKNSRLNVL